MQLTSNAYPPRETPPHPLHSPRPLHIPLPIGGKGVVIANSVALTHGHGPTVWRPGTHSVRLCNPVKVRQLPQAIQCALTFILLVKIRVLLESLGRTS